MEKRKLLKRITMNPEIMDGNPVIKGTRLTVQYIVGLLAGGMTKDDILEEHKELAKEDIQACLVFASEIMKNSAYMPLAAEVP